MAPRDANESESEGAPKRAAEEQATDKRDEGRPSPGGESDPPKADAGIEEPPKASEAAQNLGILFIAAAIGLALLLIIVGLLAAAAMSRALPAPGEPNAADAAPPASLRA